MNCETFNSIISRGGAMARDARGALTAHAETCAACAAELSAQEKLTSGLRALRNATANVVAPAALEDRLRAEFRRHAACTSAVAAPVHATENARTAPVASLAAHRDRKLAASQSDARRFNFFSSHSSFMPAAIAATIVLAVASLAALVRQDVRLAPDTTPVIAHTQPREAAIETSTSVTPVDISDEEFSPVARTPFVADARGGGGMRFEKARYSPGGEAPRPRRAKRNVTPEAREITTDFLPLVEAESLASLESGQIVRVELPRQALVSFGLPMNNERAHEPVKADVLLGDDGLARAIRFVR